MVEPRRHAVAGDRCGADYADEAVRGTCRIHKHCAERRQHAHPRILQQAPFDAATTSRRAWQTWHEDDERDGAPMRKESSRNPAGDTETRQRSQPRMSGDSERALRRPRENRGDFDARTAQHRLQRVGGRDRHGGGGTRIRISTALGARCAFAAER